MSVVNSCIVYLLKLKHFNIFLIILNKFGQFHRKAFNLYLVQIKHMELVEISEIASFLASLEKEKAECAFKKCCKKYKKKGKHCKSCPKT